MRLEKVTILQFEKFAFTQKKFLKIPGLQTVENCKVSKKQTFVRTVTNENIQLILLFRTQCSGLGKNCIFKRFFRSGIF